MTLLTVESIQCRAHQSKSGRTTFLLEYECQERMDPVYDHLCFGYSGYPGERAKDRWRDLGGLEPPPRTADEAHQRKGELADPVRLEVENDKKGYERIVKMYFADDRMPEEAAAKVASGLEDDRKFLTEGGSGSTLAPFDFSKF